MHTLFRSHSKETRVLLENELIIGQSMVPAGSSDLITYDGVPLIGTFSVGDSTVLFWSADAPDVPNMRYVYVELTDKEVAELPAYFGKDLTYKNHPLLTNRRVVVGYSDEGMKLSHIAVIECSGPEVFNEVEQLFPEPAQA